MAIQMKVRGEITDPFPNFNGAIIKISEWISSYIQICVGM